jgi:hypothetical protein
MSAESEFRLHNGFAVDDNALEAWLPELDEGNQMYL